MHECQEIWSANINQKEDRFLIYERDLLVLSNKIFDLSKIFIDFYTLATKAFRLYSIAKSSPSLRIASWYSSFLKEFLL